MDAPQLKALSVPLWLKEIGDVIVTVLMIATVLAAAWLILSDRHLARDAKKLANDVHQHQVAEAQASVDQCYGEITRQQILRPILVAIVRRTPSASPALREAARNYLATVEETMPRVSDCRKLAATLGVSP